MGQQQLLLVILVTIIVGIATVVAINTFGSAADSANVDAVRNDVASIAASAQGYYMKPTALGGGGQTFTGISFNDVGFGGNVIGGSADPKKAINSNGTYVIDGSTGTSMTITAYPSSDADYDGVNTPGSYAAASSGGTMEYTVTKDNMSQTGTYTPTAN